MQEEILLRAHVPRERIRLLLRVSYPDILVLASAVRQQVVLETVKVAMVHLAKPSKRRALERRLDATVGIVDGYTKQEAKFFF